MNERQFQKQVINFLNEQEIYHIKIWGGGFQRAGIPDLICCVNGLFFALELKAENGKATPLQMYNLRKIKESGGLAMILYPSQFNQFKQFIKEVKNWPKPSFPTQE